MGEDKYTVLNAFSDEDLHEFMSRRQREAAKIKIQEFQDTLYAFEKYLKSIKDINAKIYFRGLGHLEFNPYVEEWDYV